MMRILSGVRKRFTHGRSSEMFDNISNIGHKISEQQAKLKEATRLLDRGTVEYSRLYRSRLNLLTRLAELLIKYENMGQLRIARDLENMLLDEGIARFKPEVGEPIPRSKCKVNKVEFNGIAPGLVALVSTPGFIDADGEVILPADVFESMSPNELVTEQLILHQTSERAGPESENFLDVLLLCTNEREPE